MVDFQVNVGVVLRLFDGVVVDDDCVEDFCCCWDFYDFVLFIIFTFT